MSKYDIPLVEIMPIEYRKATRYWNRKKGRPVKVNPRLLIYWDFEIDPKITQEDMEEIIKKSHMKKRAVALENPEERIEYKYDREPNIIFLKEYPNKIFTTKAVLEEYGKSKCQQQASIFLRLLRSNNFAKFKQVSATFNPNRVGRTAKERKLVFEAAHNLFGDKIG